MGRFDTIKTTIDANIKENGNQEITGQKMNSILTEMVNATDAELTELESEIYAEFAKSSTTIFPVDYFIETKSDKFYFYLPRCYAIYDGRAIDIDGGLYDLTNSSLYEHSEKAWDGSSEAIYDIWASTDTIYLVEIKDLNNFISSGKPKDLIPVCRIIMKGGQITICEEYLKRGFDKKVEKIISPYKKIQLANYRKIYATNEKGEYNVLLKNGVPFLNIAKDFSVVYIGDDGNPIKLIMVSKSYDLTNPQFYRNKVAWDGESDVTYDVMVTPTDILLYAENDVYNDIISSDGEYLQRLPLCRVRLRKGNPLIVEDYVKRIISDDVVDKNNIKSSFSFANRDILIADGIDVQGGLLLEDGSVTSSDAESSYFRYCMPIAIPDNVRYILFEQDDFVIPNYVNCYSKNNFTGFLGRSDGMSYYDLVIGNYYGKAMELPEGTKYISYFCGSGGVQEVSSNPKIYGSPLASYGIFFGDKFVAINSGGESSFRGEPNKTEHFVVSVNCHQILQDVGNATTLEDEQKMFTDNCMIMLPSNYTRTGKPVPLVIGCHGAGGSVSANDSQTERSVLYQYLVANGYAVCDCNGFPSEWCDLVDVSSINNIGSPIAIECYTKMYQYVIANYNVQHDVLVSGSSMGGISSTNLVLSGAIPVKAQGINCPVLDTYNQIFKNPWSGGLPKTAMGVVYGFEKVNGSYVYDEEKLRGFNPIVRNMQSYTADGVRVTSVGDYANESLNGEVVTEYKYHPCALKIWHCENDDVVAYTCSKRFVKAIRNAGGNAVLRSIVTGGHEPLDVGEVLQNPSGNTSYRGATLQIRPIVEEIFMFFERYAQK